MSTQEIAEKLVDYCRKGEFQNCYQELYSPEIQSVEANGDTVKGFDAMAQKGKEWNAGIEEFNGATTGDPVVSGNYFAVPMSMNLKYKGAPEAVDFNEMCVYTVKDGKIIKEQFFYDEA